MLFYKVWQLGVFMHEIEKGRFPKHAKVLGVTFLAYILVLEAETIDTLIAEGGQVSDEQWQSLEFLEKLMTQALLEMGSNPQIGWIAMRSIEQNTRNQNKFLLSELHAFCRDDEHVVEKRDDPVLDTLIELCVVAYPYTLIPHTGMGWRSIYIPTLFRENIEQHFQQAVLKDASLSKLFNGPEDSPLMIHGSFYDSLGRGGGVQLAVLSGTILENAAMISKFRDGSLNEFINAACEQIEAVRGAIGGTPVSVPAYALFVGTGMPEGHELELEDGTLHPVSQQHIGLFPNEAMPSKTEDGFIGMVLETSVEFKLFVVPENWERDGKDWPVEFTRDGFYEKIQNIELGTTLATIGDEPVKARNTAEVMFSPLSISGASYKTGLRGASTTRILKPDEFEEVGSWIAASSRTDTSRIRLAIRRFLSATNVRLEDDDALIDAVIGLENLFGERSEISFSVANSTARLLGRDEAEKTTIFEEVKKIYGARSKIVHGQKELQYEETKKFRYQAVFYLASSLKIILKDKTELLQLSASDRVKKIALSDG